PAVPPPTSPASRPPTAGSGAPTTLPAQPSPTFVCVTGPGGSCLQPGAGLPVPQTWTPTVPGWVTSGVTGGCVAGLLPGAGSPPAGTADLDADGARLGDVGGHRRLRGRVPHPG